MNRFIASFAAVSLFASAAASQVAVRAGTIHTMAGDPITDGVVVITDGKIAAVGAADSITIPEGYQILLADVLTPGLIDGRGILGLSGLLNQDQDQDQLESSAPVQPHLRAIDAYNPHDGLIAWSRSFGTTTAHTGHALGELVSGQTMVVKLRGNTVEAALVRPGVAVAATLSPEAQKSGGKSPGTRGKMMSLLRSALIEAQAYADKVSAAESDDEKDAPSRDLKLEALASVLNGERPLIVTANRAQDIATAIRLRDEFGFELWLDHAAEAGEVLDLIKEAEVPVLLHPTMTRFVGSAENASFTTASKLRDAGIPFLIQCGFEGYVPKTRVPLFEAALAAAHGLGFEDAMASITIDAAEILGIAGRVGSIEVGKDGDLALFDGDPFEYTTHCLGVVIEGEVFEEGQ